MRADLPDDHACRRDPLLRSQRESRLRCLHDLRRIARRARSSRDSARFPRPAARRTPSIQSQPNLLRRTQRTSALPSGRSSMRRCTGAGGTIEMPATPPRPRPHPRLQPLGRARARRCRSSASASRASPASPARAARIGHPPLARRSRFRSRDVRARGRLSRHCRAPSGSACANWSNSSPTIARFAAHRRARRHRRRAAPSSPCASSTSSVFARSSIWLGAVPGAVTTLPSTAGTAVAPAGEPARAVVRLISNAALRHPGPVPAAAIASRGVVASESQRRQLEGMDHRLPRRQIGRGQHPPAARFGARRAAASPRRIRAVTTIASSRHRSTRHVPGAPAIVTRVARRDFQRSPGQRHGAPLALDRRSASAPPRRSSWRRRVDRRGQLHPRLAHSRARPRARAAPPPDSRAPGS